MAGPAWRELFQGRLAAYTVIVNLGVAVHAVDVFIISTALPSVVADIGGAAFYAWPTMLYMVASIAGTASGGWLRARLGVRNGFLLAAAFFLIGTVGCALAPTMAHLLIARTVQGTGGGLIIAQNYAMVRGFYPDSLRTRMLSSISGMWGISAVLGPLLGGGFSELGWWRGAFWASVPVILLFTVMAWRALPTAADDAVARRLPYRRLGLLTFGVLSAGASGQFESFGLRGALVVLAVLLLSLTFRLDGRARDTLFPRRSWSIGHAVGNAYWIVFLVGMTTTPVGLFIPLVAQVLYGVAPFPAGYFHALLALSWAAGAVLSSGVQRRRRERMVMIGPCLITGAVLGLASFAVVGPLAVIGLFVALIGLGVGLCYAHVVTWAMSAARPGEEAITAASIPTMQSIGIAFGSALAGLVANAAGLGAGVSPPTVAAVASWVYGSTLICPLLMALLAFRLVRREPGLSG